MAPERDRRARERLGRLAETLCALSLRLRLYRVLDRRVRTPRGEIDIVATRGNLVAFIEVKARRDFDLGAAAVTAGQQRRVTRAAEAYLALHPALARRAVRFDVMLIAPLKWPRHIEDAWRAP